MFAKEDKCLSGASMAFQGQVEHPERVFQLDPSSYHFEDPDPTDLDKVVGMDIHAMLRDRLDSCPESTVESGSAIMVLGLPRGGNAGCVYAAGIASRQRCRLRAGRLALALTLEAARALALAARA